MELESSQDPGKGQKCPFSNQNRWHKVPENTLDPLLEHNFGHNLILDNNPNFFFICILWVAHLEPDEWLP